MASSSTPFPYPKARNICIFEFAPLTLLEKLRKEGEGYVLPKLGVQMVSVLYGIKKINFFSKIKQEHLMFLTDHDKNFDEILFCPKNNDELKRMLRILALDITLTHKHFFVEHSNVNYSEGMPFIPTKIMNDKNESSEIKELFIARLGERLFPTSLTLLAAQRKEGQVDAEPNEAEHKNMGPYSPKQCVIS